MDQRKKSFAIASLRKASYRWPGRYLAEKRHKLGRNQYQCPLCQGVFGRKDTQMDHVIPVVDPVLGWQGFDEYIDRMLADEFGWQRICCVDREEDGVLIEGGCHGQKTRLENNIRNINKKPIDKPIKKAVKSRQVKLPTKGKK